MDDNQTTVQPPTAEETVVPVVQMTGEDVASEASQIAKTSLDEVSEMPLPLAENVSELVPNASPQAETLTNVAGDAPFEMSVNPTESAVSLADETIDNEMPEAMPAETLGTVMSEDAMPGMEAEPAAVAEVSVEPVSTDVTPSL